MHIDVLSSAFRDPTSEFVHAAKFRSHSRVLQPRVIQLLGFSQSPLNQRFWIFSSNTDPDGRIFEPDLNTTPLSYSSHIVCKTTSVFEPAIA